MSILTTDKETEMQTVSVVEAREQFSDLIARVAYGNQRVIVERRGRPMVALISIADLQQLEEMESEIGWRKQTRIEALQQAAAARERILQERQGVVLPDSAAILAELREERTRELTGGR